MHRGGREGGANYLQVVTKDTLEDQVGLSISIVRLASRCGIQLASLKEICPPTFTEGVGWVPTAISDGMELGGTRFREGVGCKMV